MLQASMLQAHMRMFASYNAWANAKLYSAVRLLPDSDYRRDAGVFFGSMHATLNHILVADRIWLRRFTGKGDAPSRLDAILYGDFESLRQAREAEDIRIASWVGSLDEAALARPFTYAPVSEPSQEVTQPLAPALAHLFNHQTHHRGQAHAILTRLTGDAPALDLIYFQRKTPKS